MDHLTDAVIPKFFDTFVLIVVAVGVAAVAWISANLLFDQARHRWTRFSALASFATGFLGLLVLQGNRLLRPHGPGSETITAFGELVWTPLIGGLAVAALGTFMAGLDDPRQRRLVGLASGTGLGALIGARLVSSAQPELEPLALVVAAVTFTVLAVLVARLRGRNVGNAALWGGAFGWLIGAFGAPELGDGSMAEAIIGAVVPGALLGCRFGLTTNPNAGERARIDNRSRAWIFLTPAPTFVAIALVVPTIITIWLSLKDRDSEQWVWLSNYESIFSDARFFDVENWTDLFGSSIFWLGALLLGAGIMIGGARRKVTGEGFVPGGPAFSPLVLATILLTFAVFSVLRGTVFNSLWWVFTVTVFSTGLGLAIAVLADRARGESVAKSVIFMPMAISLVGASIIWRFVYIARDTSKPQTGVMNALWVGLGDWSTGDGLATVIGSAALWLIVAALGISVTRLLVRRRFDQLPLRVLCLVFVLWLSYRFSFDGIGGFRSDGDGGYRSDTVFFVQDQPFNNVWLMVILIWIQTGFAMVILSAAIKAVPSELIEAAAVDGATESETFWRVVLPQISTTIGVVITTLIVLVMKVYDIVKVVTNSNFETRVLANEMFQEAFLFQNTGVGAALAVLIFLSVLPVMVTNIRRMQREV